MNTPPAHALDNGLAQKPPLIWQSWYAYGCSINEQEVKAAADAIVSTGLKAAGYEYINIDDCWPAKQRTPDGSLQADPTRFPDGMKALADYVHSKGLKIGLYSSPQEKTCAGFPGSLGHEEQDVETFAKWGIDWLKYDTCGGGNVQANDETMLHALQATGRKIVFQTTALFGSPSQYSWVLKDSNMWRSTGDIPTSWEGVLSVLGQQAGLSKYPGPGSWNELSNLFPAPSSATPNCTDPTGTTLTRNQWQAMYSLWALMMTPLQISDHPACLVSSPYLQSVYTNRDILAVDQQWAGRVGDRVAESGSTQVWDKPMPDGSVALVLLNTGPAQNAVTVSPRQLGLPRSPVYRVRNLWTHRQSIMRGAISASVPAQATRMFRIWPAHGNMALGAALPTLGVAGLDWATGGQQTTVTTTVDNVGTSALTNVHVALNAPAGWTIAPAAPVSSSAILPGTPRQITWQVTPPVSQSVLTTNVLSATATYRSQGRDYQLSAGAPVTVAGPVRSPYKTTTWESPYVASHYAQAGNAFAIIAAGADVWCCNPGGPLDQYGAIYQPTAVTSQTTVTVKITHQDNTDGWAKAGIMIRNNINGEGESPGYVIMTITPGVGTDFGWNNDGQGYINSQTAVGPSSYPMWLRLVRNGSTFTGLYSTDGKTWTQTGSASVPGAAATQDAGMFVSSHTLQTAGRVDFTGFTVQH